MDNLVTIELTKDQPLIPTLHKYLSDKRWSRGVILSASGSLYNVVVSNPITFEFPPAVLPITISGPCEVISLSGEIIPESSAESGYRLHLHGAVSHGSGVVNGGGLKGGTVYKSLRLYVWAEGSETQEG